MPVNRHCDIRARTVVSAFAAAFTALPIALFAPAPALVVATSLVSSQYSYAPAVIAVPPPVALGKSNTPSTASAPSVFAAIA